MKFLAFLLLAVIGQAAIADDGQQATPMFDQKADRGWFWYEKDPEPKPKKKVEDTQQPAPAPTKEADKEEKHPMTVAWLRKIMPVLEERAIDNPTRENLSAYFYAKRVMLDKSQRFMEEGKKLIASDPMLDENNRVPSATFAKAEFLNKEYEAKQASLRYLAKNIGGLFVFFDSKCSFCRIQISTIAKLQESYGFLVKYISVDGQGLPGMKDWVKDNGHVKMLDLKVYPTTVLAVPPSTYLIVSQGMMAKDQMEERILTAAQSNHLLPADMEKNLNVWDRGVLTVDDMQDGAFSNPDDFVKYVKDKLKDRY